MFFFLRQTQFFFLLFGEIFENFLKKSFERVAAHFQISQHCKKIDWPQLQVLRSGDLILVYGWKVTSWTMFANGPFLNSLDVRSPMGVQWNVILTKVY